MSTRSLVGFGDADSFYASAEVVRRPWLAGLPVGVLGNQGACVIARNYPMKRFGVKVGEPIWEAKQKCPHGVYVKRDFRWYETLSRKMLGEIGTFSRRSSTTRSTSSSGKGSRRGSRNYQSDGRTRSRPHEADGGMPMTVAFARTRTLAKLFADTAKPFGAVAVEDPDHETELLADFPSRRSPGSRGRAPRLEPLRHQDLSRPP